MDGSAAETELTVTQLKRKSENTGNRELMANGGSFKEKKVINVYNRYKHNNI